MNSNTKPLQSWERQGLIWNARLSPTQKFVLFAYESFASSDSHECFPSYGTIAERTGYEKRSVITAVRELTSMGILTKELRYRPNGSQTSNNYKIVYSSLARMINDHPPSDPNSPPPMIVDHPPSDRRSPPELIQLTDPKRTCVTRKKQPSHTPEDFDQASDPPQDLETPIPDSPQDLNLEQPKLDNNPNPVSKNPDREISSAAAPRENAPSPADFAPCAPFYELPDESAIISVWNAKKGKKWRRMGSGCLNGNMIEGLRHFMSQAGGDKALAVEFLGKAIEVAAQDDWLGTKNIRPSQGLDPFSQTFLGHFLPDALATGDEKISQTPTVAQNHLQCVFD